MGFSWQVCLSRAATSFLTYLSHLHSQGDNSIPGILHSSAASLSTSLLTLQEGAIDAAVDVL